MRIDKANALLLPNGSRMDIESTTVRDYQGRALEEAISVNLTEPKGYTHTICGIDLDSVSGELTLTVFNRDSEKPDYQTIIDYREEDGKA